MGDSDKTKAQLIEELSTLRRRIAELEIFKDYRKLAEKARRRAYDELEHRIAERTAELVKANQQLKQEIEERKRTEAELKRTKEYLENVIANSVDAIGIVDREGRFILWNRRAAEIYGYHLEELADKTAFELYADPDELDRMLGRLRRDGVVREFEILMKKKDGTIVPMDISISLLKDDQGRTIGSVCLARDLSERKKAEAALTYAQAELRRYSSDLERQVREQTREINSILRYTPSVVYIKDREGRYTLVNSRYEELFKISQEQIRGKCDHDMFPRALADQIRASDLRVLALRQPCQAEEAMPPPDGRRTYLSVKFPLYNEQGTPTGLCGIATDITELKQAQDQLRRLSGSIMASQEKERKAIARELHDELGQVLTALRMDAVWLSERLQAPDPKAGDRALAMCGLIDHTIDEVRGLATRLRPGVLDDLGLIDALEWYIADFEKRTGIACTFKHRQVPNIDGIGATAAYRIVQEALTNVTRHAAATQVKVSLEPKKGMVTLAVADNGRGFDLQEIAASECLGLVGMRERAGLLGGSLEIRSRPGKGTKVCFKLPADGTRSA
ncbi:MAG: PAS domain-containing protein [Proteobacteria bacterium]|nr:PAS domain-containing protein [Pseudomonadota bacterium]